jgi:hypothetical protein
MDKIMIGEAAEKLTSVCPSMYKDFWRYFTIGSIKDNSEAYESNGAIILNLHDKFKYEWNMY